ARGSAEPVGGPGMRGLMNRQREQKYAEAEGRGDRIDIQRSVGVEDTSETPRYQEFRSLHLAREVGHHVVGALLPDDRAELLARRATHPCQAAERDQQRLAA